MAQVVPDGWTLTATGLTRAMKRADFMDALALVVAVGLLAEAADHHPDIDLRYRTVRLSLCTHSAGGQVTDRDFALAEKINELSEESIRLCTSDLRQRLSV